MKHRAKHFAEIWKTIQLVNKTIQKCIYWSQRIMKFLHRAQMKLYKSCLSDIKIIIILTATTCNYRTIFQVKPSH